ncbi:MAG: lysoplasmalogenase [Flavobacteriaceae bacterium]|nr:lysoplasmalogenase [Flavobacteriaceae bacterium]
MEKRKLILGLFVLVVALDFIGILVGNQLIRFVFKPLIMLLLMAYYSIIVEPKNKLYLAVLLFSFLGDVFLLFDSNLNFMLGLASFLMAHILLIKIVVGVLKKSSVRQKITAITPFAIVLFGLIFLLKDNLGGLLIPVIVYAFVITTFGAISFLIFLTEKSIPNLLLLGGATFFILSDSTLAINKFYQSEAYFPVFIMITYVLAQYLICRFMIFEDKK